MDSFTLSTDSIPLLGQTGGMAAIRTTQRARERRQAELAASSSFSSSSSSAYSGDSSSYYLESNDESKPKSEKDIFLQDCRDGYTVDVRDNLWNNYLHTDSRGNNCLLIAINNQHERMVDVILDAKSTLITHINNQKENAFILAAKLPSSKILDKLIHRVKNLKKYLGQVDSNGNNALQNAIIDKRVGNVQLLLSTDVVTHIDLAHTNHKGENILHLLLITSSQVGGKFKGNTGKSKDSAPKTKPKRKNPYLSLANELAMDSAHKELLKAVDSDGNTIFINSCKVGDTKLIRYLATKHKELDININHQDKRGRTGLHYLIGYPKNLTWLLDNRDSTGVNATIQDSAGLTVLGIAMTKGKFKTFNMLLAKSKDYGIPVNIKDVNNNNVVLRAIGHGKSALKYIQVLYDSRHKTGVDFVTRGRNGVTPLQLAIHNERYEVVDFLTEHLSQKEIQINTETEISEKSFYDPSLVILADRGKEKLLRSLIEKYGVEALGQTNRRGYTPLMLSIRRGHTKTADFLIDEIALKGHTDFQKKVFNTTSKIKSKKYGDDVFNQTALHLAVVTSQHSISQIPVINKLITHTDLTIQDSANNIPLLSCFKVIESIHRHPTNYGSRSKKEGELHLEEVVDSTIKMIDQMKEGNNLFKSNNVVVDSNVFIRAIDSQDPRILKALETVPDLNLNQLDKQGRNAIMVALSKSPAMTKTLFSIKGLKYNLVDKNNDTVLTLAQQHQPKLLPELLARVQETKFNINSLGSGNHSALMKAAEKGDVKNVQGILAYTPHQDSEPLNIYQKNTRGETALSIACRATDIPVVVALVSHFRILSRVKGRFGTSSLKISVTPEAEKELSEVAAILDTMRDNYLKKYQDKRRGGKTLLDIKQLSKILGHVKEIGMFGDKLCSHITDKFSCDSSYCEWKKGTCHSPSRNFLLRVSERK